jgi:GntR family transcriptional regulator, sialic acid-inducible nan operon repressor
MDVVHTEDRIQRRKLYHEVMDRLVHLIRSEQLAVGDQLPSERELMERYGIGRPAVREALQNLAWMGVISINHGERARVVQPNFQTLFDSIKLPTRQILTQSQRSLDDLKAARLIFEIQIVRLAAERAQPDDVERLRERLEQQRAAVADPPEFVRRDMLFHREIASITGNSIFPSLSEAIMGWLRDFYIDLVRAPGAEHATLSDHDRIVAAIAAGNTAEAERAMSDHIERANELYLQPATPS